MLTKNKKENVFIGEVRGKEVENIIAVMNKKALNNSNILVKGTMGQGMSYIILK